MSGRQHRTNSLLSGQKNNKPATKQSR